MRKREQNIVFNFSLYSLLSDASGFPSSNVGQAESAISWPRRDTGRLQEDLNLFSGKQRPSSGTGIIKLDLQSLSVLIFTKNFAFLVAGGESCGELPVKVSLAAHSINN